MKASDSCKIQVLTVELLQKLPESFHHDLRYGVRSPGVSLPILYEIKSSFSDEQRPSFLQYSPPRTFHEKFEKVLAILFILVAWIYHNTFQYLRNKEFQNGLL